MRVKINGKTIRLGSEVGRGGEGVVYAHCTEAGIAVKVYTRPTLERVEKVSTMVSNGFARYAPEVVAFPRDIVYDMNGQIIGFTMKRANSCGALHELSTPKSRHIRFPEFDYRKIVLVAVNLASAVGEVHRNGCVIGDINESGALVSNDSTVTLVDADSFQIIVDGRLYPCTVAKADYTPPELQNGATQRRKTQKHDEFGLALLIFQLLFMGRGPFAGQPIKQDDQRFVTPSDAIASYQFAYTVKRRGDVSLKPPTGSLILDDFPSKIQTMFERAFGTDPNDRPEAREWVDALSELEGQLVQNCEKNRRHWFPKHNHMCTWCRIGKTVDMFPDESISNSSKGGNSDKQKRQGVIKDIGGNRPKSRVRHVPSVKNTLKVGSHSKTRPRKSAQPHSVVRFHKGWIFSWKGLTIIGALIVALMAVLWGIMRSEVQEYIPWDDNGDGRVSCAEARRYGIAPVPRSHPAYRYMWDRDGDGVVCERPGTSTIQRQNTVPSIPPKPVQKEQERIPWDDNGNGRVSCAEAERHGIVPVRKDHPAYPYMWDRDGDGVVCE